MNKKLQVFVSSTYTDLIEERQAAVEAILDAGHIPAGMELFKAGKSQMETIRKWIDESDVYMLILGGRYGSIEEESGLSYTELEYRYAISKNMPVISIVLDDSFLFTKAASSSKNAVFEKDNMDKYETFKSFVMSKIVKPINNIESIKTFIHSNINDIQNNEEYNLVGWVKGNTLNNDPELTYRIEFLENLNRNLRSQIASPNNKILGNFTVSELISILSSVDLCDKLISPMIDYDMDQILEFLKWEPYRPNALYLFYALCSFLSLGIPNSFFNINKHNVVVMTIILECASILINCGLIKFVNIETIELTDNAKKLYAQLLSDNYSPSVNLLPSLIKLAELQK